MRFVGENVSVINLFYYNVAVEAAVIWVGFADECVSEFFYSMSLFTIDQ